MNAISKYGYNSKSSRALLPYRDRRSLWVQTLEQSDRFGRPHLLRPLVPDPRLRDICGEISHAERIKNNRIVCRSEVHGCPRIPAFDQSTQGGPGGFDVTGSESHRSNSFD
jgi:hypothetical protein